MESAVIISADPILRRRYFYGCGWALHLTSQALNAIWLSCRVGFLIRSRMPRRICPVIQRHGANVNAHTVSGAHIPVDSNVSSMYAQLRRRLHGTPDFVAVVFACNLSILLKIRIYRQTLHLSISRNDMQILGFLPTAISKLFFSPKHI